MTDNRKIALDYVTEWQTNDEPWREFEYQELDNCWYPCSKYTNPCRFLNNETPFRRKPKTTTVTISCPKGIAKFPYSNTGLELWFKTKEDRDAALAAIRAEMEKDNA